MPKGYWMVHMDITDPDNYPNYIKAAGAVLQEYGGKFLVRGGRHEAAEGAARSRHVLLEFESYEQAVACYRSPAYQEAVALRKAYADSELIILEGHEPPDT